MILLQCGVINKWRIRLWVRLCVLLEQLSLNVCKLPDTNSGHHTHIIEPFIPPILSVDHSRGYTLANFSHRNCEHTILGGVATAFNNKITFRICVWQYDTSCMLQQPSMTPWAALCYHVLWTRSERMTRTIHGQHWLLTLTQLPQSCLISLMCTILCNYIFGTW